MMVVAEFTIFRYFLSFVVGQTKNHLGCVVSSALNDGFYEFREILFILLVKFNDHTRIDEVDLNFLFLCSDKFSHLEFLLAIFKVNLFDSFLGQGLGFYSELSNIPHIFEKIPNFSEEIIGFL